jgi:hypothetical protein
MQAPTTAITFKLERVRILFSFHENVRILTPFIIIQDKILLKRIFPTDSCRSNLPGAGIRIIDTPRE